MKLSEDEAKRFLERLCPLQETEQQLLCPRCGRNELYSGLYFFLNSLSRYAHVYICEKRWMSSRPGIELLEMTGSGWTQSSDTGKRKKCIRS